MLIESSGFHKYNMTPQTPPKSSRDADLERSLDAAFKDGMAYGAMVGCAETYFSACGVFLRASNLQVGVLSALPPFLGSLSQILALRIQTKVKSRRALVSLGIIVQALTLLPLILLVLIGASTTHAPLFLIVIAVLYYSALGLTAPAWNSLIGDLVPPNLRGQFLGTRNQRIGLATCVMTIVAGIILNAFSEMDLTAFGFAIIFTLATVARLYSAKCTAQYVDLPYEVRASSYFSFIQFILRTRVSNFARFVIFTALINGFAAFSAPYFSVFMLRELKFPYIEFAVVTAAAMISGVLTHKHWGKLVDQFGSKNILTFCSFGVSITPVLWLVTRYVPYLIFVQIYSGFVWAGFNLASSTFMFDAVTPPKRARCAAYQGLVTGIAVLLGSLSGGYVVQHLPNSVGIGSLIWIPQSPLLLIFLLSGVFRFFTAAFFLRRFDEVRPYREKLKISAVFQFAHIKPFAAGELFLIPLRSKEARNDKKRKSS